MLRPLARATAALLSRVFLWMTVSAVLMLGALKYGPTLLASALPEDLRPEQSELTQMSPQRVMDALGEIRGALD